MNKLNEKLFDCRRDSECLLDSIDMHNKRIFFKNCWKKTPAHPYILTNGGSQVNESLVKQFVQKVHIVSNFLIHCCWQYTKMLPNIGALHRDTGKNNEWEAPEGPPICQRESSTLRLHRNLHIKLMMDKIPEMYV